MRCDDLMSLVFLLSDKDIENSETFSKIKNIDYLAVLDLANSEFLTSALYYRMDKHGLFDIIEDEKLHAFLRELFVLNTRRNEQILLQLKEIASIFQGADIELLLLKGAASLVEQEYEHIGIRYLSDIDLMVQPEEVEKAYSLLIDAGYKNVGFNYSFDDLHRHLPPLEKEGMPAIVELHRRAVKEVSIAKTISFAPYAAYKIDSTDFPGTWAFKPVYRLYHAFVHTEVDDNHYDLRVLDLRHLYDFTVLAKRYDQEVDWLELSQMIESFGLTKNFQSYLYTAKRLFGLETPLTIDTSDVHDDYRKILKSFELRNTLRGKLYPLLPKLHHIYSSKRIRSIYKYDNHLYYIFYLVKYLVYQLKTHVFCKGCLKYIISRL